jgi:hypothetical protein
VNAKPTNTTRNDRKQEMSRRQVGRAVVCMAIACVASVLSARPAIAQATYTYHGNPFTLFSCGPAVPPPGDVLCSTPGPNSFTSYTAADFVSGTLTFTNPLPANMTLQDVTGLAGFQLILNDGQHTVTNAITAGLIVQVATDAGGNITSWWLIMNTGGTDNGGIGTVNFSDITHGTEVFDQGVLACCDPGIPGNLAFNFSSPGTWTSGSGTPSPATLVTNLINLVSNPFLQLTTGQISSLTDKLTNALASIQAGQNKQAINQLNAFISSVQTWLKTGKISPQSAGTLIAAANAIIAVLH